jgi:DNA-directed RNA polymerase subunit RPC12/RpoP
MSLIRGKGTGADHRRRRSDRPQFALTQFMRAHFDYACPKCGKELTPSRAAMMFSPHSMGWGKYLRCPNCARRSWVRPSGRIRTDPVRQSCEVPDRDQTARR